MNEKKLARHFAEKHIPLKPEWLRTCIEFLKRSTDSETQHSDAILDHVMLQFLYSDLSDSLNPVMKIPEHAAKVVITKKMIFQLTSYTNISVSLYEQLSESTRHNENLSWFHGGTKICKEENRDSENDHTFDKNNNSLKQTKKRGMLRLELTDGVNTVKAVEIEEVFDETFLVPGVKILITGNVKCRRGVLLLDNSNSDLLGGRIQTMKIDKVKQLSIQLNIDLEKDKDRRKEPVNRAASVTILDPCNIKNQQKHDRSKNNSLLNQSTMSPFLIKTDRKTGEITSRPQCDTSVHEEPIENWDFSVEEISPVHIETVEKSRKELLQPPIKRLSSLVIEDSVQGKEQEKIAADKTLDGWAFGCSDKFPTKRQKPIKTSEPFKQHLSDQGTSEAKKRQLPGQLLKSSSSRPTLGSPSMAAEKRREISEWVWDESNRETEQEEEKVLLPLPSKRGKEDSVVEIPRCFLKNVGQVAERHVNVPEVDRKPIFLRTLHGPRIVVEDFRKNSKNRANTEVIEHFSTVKSPTSKPKCTSSIAQPIQESLQYEEVTEDYPEEMDEVISVTPVPQRIVYCQDENEEEEEEYFENIDQEDEQDTSIMECTIEREGQLELKRWGLGGRNKATTPSEVEEEHVLVSTRDTSLPYYMHTSTETVPSSSKIVYPQPTLPCSWDFPVEKLHRPATPPQQLMKEKRIKTEADERKIIKTLDRYSSTEIKNKLSENVQMYKTPFAKRLPSSDSSSKTTDKLFQRMADLEIVPLADALVNRKFWLMSKVIVVMPTICHQVHELRSDGVDWLFQITITDTSAARVRCRVATDLLSRLFGFTVQQCKHLFNSNQAEELRSKKAEAERKLVGFNRLDLLIWIEVSPEHEKLPLVVDVKTVSDALNIL